ncbi:hypothetical protein [Duganella violaceipulchra]|uniref:Uncharacterized protein n=1 Tax=Duganella violaceipulchra TaxID=2849652 RepID=A0AA41H8S3_9BURK|nr:hypothetical protein [Duganella violaceicalia]MBV6321946.1 hypothetical protein [Duganella violaceicalia]MCP2007059.1 hypothetical protein [Duganella violaceicalia]
MKTATQDHFLCVVIVAAIAEARRAGDDVKVASEAAAKAYVAGLVAADAPGENSGERVISATGQVEYRPPS